jgi:preprotein translocase subunit YajC
MTTFDIILSVACLAALVYLFLLWFAKEKSELKNFRQNLNSGQTVVISDGQTTYKARIVRVSDTYVRVMHNGRTAGVAFENVYPCNYFKLDEDGE